MAVALAAAMECDCDYSYECGCVSNVYRVTAAMIMTVAGCGKVCHFDRVIYRGRVSVIV